MNLASLSPEILSQVLNEIASTWIINLWLTGSRSLRHTMSSRVGVTSIALKRTRAPKSTSRLPEIVASFKCLTSLSISSPESIETDSSSWKNLATLSSLEYLELNVPASCQSLLRLHSTYSGAYSLENTSLAPILSHTMKLTLANAFPCLHTLKLGGKDSQMRDTDIAILPPTLTTLKLPTNLFLTAACFHNLALLPLITSISLNIDLPEPASLEGFTLPPTLTRLHLMNTSFRPFDVPLSFWNGCGITNLDVQMTQDSYQHMPASSIQKLVIPGLVPNSIPHLPQLKILHMYECVTYDLLRLQTSLPSTLESLTVRYFNTEDESMDYCFPSSLKHLTVEWEAGLEVHLQATDVAILKCKELISLSMKSSCLFNQYFVSSLPPTLTLLHIPLALMDAQPDRLATSFPRGLTSLKFGHRSGLSYTPLADIGLLPRTLTTLGIAVETDEAEDSVIDFPEGLGELKLFIAPIGQAYHPNLPKRILEACHSLPLRHLKLETESFMNYPREAIELLPLGLEYLKIVYGSMGPGCFAALPNGLSYLYIDSSDLGSVTGDELVDLPKRLRTLILKGLDVSPDHIALIPHGVTELSARIVGGNDSEPLRLPSHLTLRLIR